MNTFALVPAIRKEPSQMGEHYLDIEIDEKPLAHHFAGLLGAHPSKIPSFGWDKRPGKLSEYEMGELLGVNTLESGRVPVRSCPARSVGVSKAKLSPCGSLSKAIMSDGPTGRTRPTSPSRITTCPLIFQSGAPDR